MSAIDRVLYGKILEETRNPEFRTANGNANFALREILHSLAEITANSSNDEAVILSLQKLGHL